MYTARAARRTRRRRRRGARRRGGAARGATVSARRRAGSLAVVTAPRQVPSVELTRAPYPLAIPSSGPFITIIQNRLIRGSSRLSPRSSRRNCGYCWGPGTAGGAAEPLLDREPLLRDPEPRRRAEPCAIAAYAGRGGGSVIVVVVTAVLAVAVAAAVGGYLLLRTRGTPQQTAASYLRGWERGSYAAMGAGQRQRAALRTWPGRCARPRPSSASAGSAWWPGR